MNWRPFLLTPHLLDMNLSDLEAFIAVVESGSIVAAAGRLYLTQSAVTKRIQILESSLDVILLDRQTRPIRPTRTGKEVYNHAVSILASIVAMKTAAAHDGDPSGDFCLAVAPSLGEAVVPALFDTLGRHFPRLAPRIFVQNTRTLLERLACGSLAAGILVCSEGDDPPDTLITEVVGKLPFVLVGSERLSGEIWSLADLSQQSWVVGIERCPARYYLDSLFRSHGLRFQVRVESENKDSHLALASQGTGLAVVPLYLLQASPMAEVLRVLDVEGFNPTQNVWLAYSKYLGSQEKAVDCIRSTVVDHLKSLESHPSFVQRLLRA